MLLEMPDWLVDKLKIMKAKIGSKEQDYYPVKYLQDEAANSN